MPELSFPLLLGVSSGAINVAHLASRRSSLSEASADLSRLWGGLEASSVMKVDPLTLATNVLVWGVQLLSGGLRLTPGARSLVDCAPLGRLLQRHLADRKGEIRGIRENLEDGRLRAVALTTTCYTTRDSVTFVQGCGFPAEWNRSGRAGIEASLTVDHVLASGALPFLFPAVRIGRHWHGDGAVRLAAPLAPAIGLGADRIVVVSTDERSEFTEDGRDPAQYPSPETIAGTLLHTVFHDRLAEDVRRLRRLNRVLRDARDAKAGDLRRVGVFVLRPSENLAVLAREYEDRLPRSLRFMIRGLGTGNTRGPDLLSMLLFEPEYLERLMEIGDRDAEARREELRHFLAATDPARAAEGT